MNKKYKISLIIVSILLIITIGLLCFKKFVYDKNSNEKPSVYSSVVEKMDEYGYTLDDRDSDLFKEKYLELKTNLTSDEINYEEYAKSLSELFVIDLLTISNKVNKYDVGGLEYLYDSEKEMFKGKIMDTIYDFVEDNSYGKRNQELPTVSNVTISDIKESQYEIDNSKKESYDITMDIEYEKDMGYDKKVTITIVKDENKMYVVKYTA